MPAHRKQLTAEDIARTMGFEVPPKEPGPNEVATKSVIEGLAEPNEALASMALSLAKLMDEHPSAATAKEYRATIIALCDLVPKPTDKLDSDEDKLALLAKVIKAA